VLGIRHKSPFQDFSAGPASRAGWRPGKVPGLPPGCLDIVRKKCITTMRKVRSQFPRISGHCSFIHCWWQE